MQHNNCGGTRQSGFMLAALPNVIPSRSDAMSLPGIRKFIRRARELVDIPGEDPHVLKQIIGALSDSCGYDRGDLARLTRVSIEDFADRFDCDGTPLRLAK